MFCITLSYYVKHFVFLVSALLLLFKNPELLHVPQIEKYWDRRVRVPRTEPWSSPTFSSLIDVVCAKIFNKTYMQKLSAQKILVF